MATRRPQIIVQVRKNETVTERRRRAITKRVTQIASGTERIARIERARAVRVIEICVPIERNLVEAQPVARRERPKFGDGHAHAELEPSRNLLVCCLTLVINTEIEAIVIAPENVPTERNILIEEIGLGETKLDRFRKGGIVDRGTKLLPLTTEIALADRGIDDEAFEAGVTRRQLKLARRFFFDVGLEDNTIRGGTLFLRDFQLFLEEAQALDAFL